MPPLVQKEHLVLRAAAGGGLAFGEVVGRSVDLLPDHPRLGRQVLAAGARRADGGGGGLLGRVGAPGDLRHGRAVGGHARVGRGGLGQRQAQHDRVERLRAGGVSLLGAHEQPPAVVGVRHDPPRRRRADGRAVAPHLRFPVAVGDLVGLPPHHERLEGAWQKPLHVLHVVQGGRPCVVGGDGHELVVGLAVGDHAHAPEDLHRRHGAAGERPQADLAHVDLVVVPAQPRLVLDPRRVHPRPRQAPVVENKRSRVPERGEFRNSEQEAR